MVFARTNTNVGNSSLEILTWNQEKLFRLRVERKSPKPEMKKNNPFPKVPPVASTAWSVGKHLSRCDQVIKKAAKNLRSVIVGLMEAPLQVYCVLETDIKSSKLGVVEVVGGRYGCLNLRVRVLDD